MLCVSVQRFILHQVSEDSPLEGAAELISEGLSGGNDPDTRKLTVIPCIAGRVHGVRCHGVRPVYMRGSQITHLTVQATTPFTRMKSAGAGGPALAGMPWAQLLHGAL